MLCRELGGKGSRVKPISGQVLLARQMLTSIEQTVSHNFSPRFSMKVLYRLLLPLLLPLTLFADSSLPEEAAKLIESLDLKKHVEGGYYRQTFKANHRETMDTEVGPRTTLTSIYYLLTRESPIGHFHLNQSDIVHYFHAGDPLKYYLIHPDGSLETLILGPDPAEGHQLQMTVRGGIWKASEIIPDGEEGEGYSLIGEAVSPGFEYRDMTLGNRDWLTRQFPEHADLFQRMSYETAKQELDIVQLEKQPWYEAEDRAVAREIASPRNSRLTQISIADIKIPPGVTVKEHYHKKMEEVYFIVEGSGIVSVNGIQKEVRVGDAVVIMPYERHTITNASDSQMLRLHVTCSPPWSPERLHFDIGAISEESP